jgi:hypothetical protein
MSHLLSGKPGRRDNNKGTDPAKVCPLWKHGPVGLAANLFILLIQSLERWFPACQCGGDTKGRIHGEALDLLRRIETDLLNRSRDVGGLEKSLDWVPPLLTGILPVWYPETGQTTAKFAAWIVHKER